jgi:ATP-dependent RNA helicase DeaD
MANDFTALGIPDDLAAALAALGYEEPTAIQRAAIPPLLEGRDLVGLAATGTGKTAAFAVPLVAKAAGRPRAAGQAAALVLVPTRELAMQVAQAVLRYGAPRGVVVAAIYGGAAYEPQLKALRRGVDVVVATPGRALDHLRRGTLALGALQVLVLDECDEMLDMGFEADIEAVLAAAPPERQMALFSATLPPRIATIAARHLREPVRVDVARERPAAGAAPRVRQVAYVVGRAYKQAALGRVLDAEAPGSAIVFARTRTEVDELTVMLAARGVRAEALHGGLSQAQRERVVARLRTADIDLVIATDVAARGLDVPRLTHVINFDVPASPDDYVHRIGRTGRAGRAGVAITLAEPREHRLLRAIEQATRQPMELGALPSVADVRARRLEQVRAAVGAALGGGDLAGFHGVVESLAADHSLLDVAAAAVKLLHDDLGGSAAEEEIPIIKLAKPALKPKAGRDKKAGPRPTRGSWEIARLHLSAGKKDGVRPADIVGALTNGAGLEGWAIGAVTIGERESTVEVPAEIAAELARALAKDGLRGKKLKARVLPRG